jgi:hypothetical protein
VFVKKRITWFAVPVCALLCALALAGCRGKEASTGDATETIAPAAPQPATTETEMTQTVDVEDSRSEADGGSLTESTTASTATTVTSAAPQTATTPQAKPPQRQ